MPDEPALPRDGDAASQGPSLPPPPPVMDTPAPPPPVPVATPPVLAAPPPPPLSLSPAPLSPVLVPAAQVSPPPRGRRPPAGLLVLAGLVAVAVLIGTASAVVWLRNANGGAAPVAARPAADAETAASDAAPPPSPVGETGPPSPSDPASTTADPAGDLIAADEFTGTAPDTSKWGLYNSTTPNGGSSAPAQVRVAGGELQVVGTGRNPSGAGNLSGGLCWCGSGGNRTYGKWRIRARFDAGAGYGQIVGLWPQSDNPVDGSITLVSTREPDKRTLRSYLVWNQGSRTSDERTLRGDFTAWHTYTVEWRATYVKIQVDDRLVYDSTTNPKAVVPRVPMHLIMQQTVGPHEGVPAPGPNTPDRVTMHIDWVRMYR